MKPPVEPFPPHGIRTVRESRSAVGSQADSISGEGRICFVSRCILHSRSQTTTLRG